MTDILIWDSPCSLPANISMYKKVIFWRKHSTFTHENYISILNLAEENGEELRKNYTNWVFEAGQGIVEGKSIVDCYQIRSGFSAWWMSLIVEKCNWIKSPHIHDVIKLMAFGEYVLKPRQITSITLITAQNALSQVLSKWAKNNNIVFKWIPCDAEVTSSTRIYSYYKSLPSFIQSLVWLSHYFYKRWPLRGIGLKAWKSSKAKITFISFLFNQTFDSIRNSSFESCFWGILPENLTSKGVKTNWIHIYLPDKVLPNARKASFYLASLNNRVSSLQTHVTLDSFLSLQVLLNTLQDWIKVQSLPLSRPKESPLPLCFEFDLWPFFKDEWKDSFVGQTLISNLLFLNLFESAFTSLPRQSTGVYLLENQGWESGMLSAWKASNHKNILAFAHSTVRFWDLRYFNHPKQFDSSHSSDFIRPDSILVNGPVARNNCILGMYNINELVTVESLRFLYLLNLDYQLNPKFIACNRTEDTSFLLNIVDIPTRLLVLGDFTKSGTALMMDILCGVPSDYLKNILITFKPHPACQIKAVDFPDLNFSISNSSISDLLIDADITYCSAATSAAVDAYCFGLPVIVFLDEITLNLSPLRGFDNVFFVECASDLVNAFNLCASRPFIKNARANYFLLDKKLTRWNKILGIDHLNPAKF